MRPPGSAPANPVQGLDAVDTALTILRQHGGRASAARRVVLEVLIEAEAHYRSADQLVAEVRARNPDVHESTVYRTLERFEELGLVYHVHLGHGPSQWLLADHRRMYLACTRCGEVIGADPAALDVLKDRVLHRFGFAVDFGHFAITGVCAGCQDG